MPIEIAKQLIRGLLDRLGYVLLKRDFLQYGLFPWLDIARLSRAWGRSVEIFFDVGAHTGETSREVLKMFPDARVLAFEPHPEVFGRLEKALSHERLSLYQLAFSDQCATVTMYEYGDESGGSLINSLVPDARFPTQFQHTPRMRTVTCSTIDQFCESNDISRIDVLKVDAEGCDLAVIKGATRMLRDGQIRFIYAEFNDLEPRDGTTGGSLVPISAFLAPFGFRYVATYTDFVLPESDMFVCANALFARCPPD